MEMEVRVFLGNIDLSIDMVSAKVHAASSTPSSVRVWDPAMPQNELKYRRYVVKQTKQNKKENKNNQKREI